MTFGAKCFAIGIIVVLSAIMIALVILRNALLELDSPPKNGKGKRNDSELK